MNDFKTLILEAFNRPYEWWWETRQPEEMEARFYTEQNNKYQVTFHKSYDFLRTRNVWSLVFGLEIPGKRYLEMGNTGTGSAFQVFATIVDITKKFIKEVNPDEIFFSGEKGLKKDALYKKMLKRLAKQLNSAGYMVSKIGDADGAVDSEVLFRVVRKK